MEFYDNGVEQNEEHFIHEVVSHVSHVEADLVRARADNMKLTRRLSKLEEVCAADRRSDLLAESLQQRIFGLEGELNDLLTESENERVEMTAFHDEQIKNCSHTIHKLQSEVNELATRLESAASELSAATGMLGARTTEISVLKHGNTEIEREYSVLESSLLKSSQDLVAMECAYNQERARNSSVQAQLAAVYLERDRLLTDAHALVAKLLHSSEIIVKLEHESKAKEEQDCHIATKVASLLKQAEEMVAAEGVESQQAVTIMQEQLRQQRNAFNVELQKEKMVVLRLQDDLAAAKATRIELDCELRSSADREARLRDAAKRESKKVHELESKCNDALQSAEEYQDRIKELEQGHLALLEQVHGKELLVHESEYIIQQRIEQARDYTRLEMINKLSMLPGSVNNKSSFESIYRSLEGDGLLADVAALTTSHEFQRRIDASMSMAEGSSASVSADHYHALRQSSQGGNLAAAHSGLVSTRDTYQHASHSSLHAADRSLQHIDPNATEASNTSVLFDTTIGYGQLPREHFHHKGHSASHAHPATHPHSHHAAGGQGPALPMAKHTHISVQQERDEEDVLVILDMKMRLDALMAQCRAREDDARTSAARIQQLSRDLEQGREEAEALQGKLSESQHVLSQANQELSVKTSALIAAETVNNGILGQLKEKAEKYAALESACKDMTAFHGEMSRAHGALSQLKIQQATLARFAKKLQHMVNEDIRKVGRTLGTKLAQLVTARQPNGEIDRSLSVITLPLDSSYAIPPTLTRPVASKDIRESHSTFEATGRTNDIALHGLTNALVTYNVLSPSSAQLLISSIMECHTQADLNAIVDGIVKAALAANERTEANPERPEAAMHLSSTQSMLHLGEARPLPGSLPHHNEEVDYEEVNVSVLSITNNTGVMSHHENSSLAQMEDIEQLKKDSELIVEMNRATSSSRVRLLESQLADCGRKHGLEIMRLNAEHAETLSAVKAALQERIEQLAEKEKGLVSKYEQSLSVARDEHRSLRCRYEESIIKHQLAVDELETANSALQLRLGSTELALMRIKVGSTGISNDHAANE